MVKTVMFLDAPPTQAWRMFGTELRGSIATHAEFILHVKREPRGTTFQELREGFSVDELRDEYDKSIEAKRYRFAVERLAETREQLDSLRKIIETERADLLADGAMNRLEHARYSLPSLVATEADLLVSCQAAHRAAEQRYRSIESNARMAAMERYRAARDDAQSELMERIQQPLEALARGPKLARRTNGVA